MFDDESVLRSVAHRVPPNLEFRCLVTDDRREQIDAVAFELDAQVSYFRGPMNVISISRSGEYLGCVWGKDFGSLKKAVLEIINAN